MAAIAAKFNWEELTCEVDGVLERVAGVTRFSGYTTLATLIVRSGAEHVCLVNNSLPGERRLEVRVVDR